MNIGELVVKRYRVEDLIGIGGEGTVARALDERTGQTVVLKRLDCCPGGKDYAVRVARFQRAARIRINHPAVVDPLGYEEAGGHHFLIMPFIDGVDVGTHVIRQGGWLPAVQAVALVRGGAAGLQAIHDHGIIHRDLKPTNILISDDGRLHIIDFGICRVERDVTVQECSGILGTLEWLSPEQARNPNAADQRSDLYALGAIFYFLLTGRYVAQGRSAAELVASICTSMPPAPRQVDASIPVQVDEACMRLLAKRPEDRFSSATALIRALDGTPAESSSDSFCGGCGRLVAGGSRYCPACGADAQASGNGSPRCLACGQPAGLFATACDWCRRPFSRPRHELLFTSGPLTGQAFLIPQGQYEVGRDELLARDQQISRRHLRVDCRNGSVAVQDLGSVNKTYVAGQLAACPLPLVAGGELWIAGNRATYTVA